MAREGYEGPVEVIEGKEGLIEVLNNVAWHTEKLTRGLGEEFLITNCSYKAFPTEALTHQPISAALTVCQDHNLAAEDVAEILVVTTTRGGGYPLRSKQIQSRDQRDRGPQPALCHRRGRRGRQRSTGLVH